MRERLAQRIDELTATSNIRSYEDLVNYSEKSGEQSAIRINSDGSRNFDDPIVVLAWRLGNGIMSSHFFYSEGKRDIMSAHDMSGVNSTLFHSHNFIEFAYVAKGTLRLLVNDTVAEFAPGDICLMDCNTRHAEQIGKEPVLLLYLSLSPEVFRYVMDTDKAKSYEEQYLRSIVMEKKEHYQYVRFHPAADARETLTALSAILEEAVGSRPGARDIIKGNVIRLLHLLTKEYSLELTNNEKAQLRRRLYSDVCAYIRKHCHDVSIEMLANKFHYNPDFFNRLIKEYSDMTYTELLQSERLHRAEQLLLTTENSVNSIAHEIGYQNLGYFYKLFRQKHGMLPTEYRAFHLK